MGARSLVVALSMLVVAAEHRPGLSATIWDEDVRVTHFEQMNYSPVAHIAAPLGGVVVVRVSLSTSGTVVTATALSGRKGLVDECVKNAMKWTFDSGKVSEAILVYRFEINGICQECQGTSTFYPPNLLVITSGQRVVTP
jgi:hypothetical protein